MPGYACSKVSYSSRGEANSAGRIMIGLGREKRPEKSVTPMNKPLPSMPQSRKPSGAIAYTVNTGTNLFPAMVMSDRAFVRVLDGQLVIFQENSWQTTT
jgi:hypothetical protein